MPDYIVKVTRTISESKKIIVWANSEEEAKDKAEDIDSDDFERADDFGYEPYSSEKRAKVIGEKGK